MSRSATKTAAQQQHLDKFMPGWRTNADEATLEALRVGVGALRVLAQASGDGYDVTADETAKPVIATLTEHVDDLAQHHRAALAALVPLPRRRAATKKSPPSRSERLVAASKARAAAKAASKQAPAKPKPKPRQPREHRPNRKLAMPAPLGDHPLAGRWVRATSELVAMDVYVVTVDDPTAAVEVWMPKTGRTRTMAVSEWALTVIDDPRA